MADFQPFKYTGDNHGDKYEIKHAAFSIKTAKTFTDLSTKLTINFFSKLDLFDDTFAEKFKPFYRGYLQKALGDGLRDIQDYGFAQLRKFEPAKPGDKLCLEVPNDRMDREDTYGQITRVYASNRIPDIMAAYDKFVNPDELFEFHKRKTGDIKRSIAFFLSLVFAYALSVCPWGLDNADRFNTYTISSILGAKWDDTPLAQFGEGKEGIGAFLKQIIEDFKDEIKKEKDLKNVNVYPVWEWVPFRADAENYPQVSRTNKAKKPTNAISKTQLQKMYLDNSKVDPTYSAVAICRCIYYHAQMMTEEFTGQNDSMFPGNLKKDDRKNYGSKAKTEANAEMLCPMRVSKDKFVIVMNSELHKELKAAAWTSPYIKEGAYSKVIDAVLGYNIIPLDTMPYGSFKLTTTDRYNYYDLYDMINPDILNQMMYTQFTAHRAIVFGIRKYQPCKYIRLTGIYMNPTVKENMIEVTDAQDLPN